MIKQGVRQQGFTLVELLVVIGVISVLMTLGITNWVQQQKKARDARRKADLEQIRSALEMYRTERGKYPENGTAGPHPYDIYSDAFFPAYMTNGIPLDPLGVQYVYIDSTGGMTYEMQADMESDSEPVDPYLIHSP